MMRKILISTFTFPPNRDGVAEAARLMAFGLADQGFDVVVVTGCVAERHNFNPHPKVRLAEFDVIRDWEILGRSRLEEQRMESFIINESPDVIICHCMDNPAALVTERAFRSVNSKTIQISHGYSVHLWRPILRPPFFGLGILVRKIPQVLALPCTLRKYDCVVFLSQRRDFRRFFDHKVARLIRHPKIKVIPNGTNPNPERGTVAMFKENLHIGEGILVLCVANFSPRKNQALAIRAFRRAAIPDSVLVLIGSEFNEYSKGLIKLDADLRSQFPEGKVVFIEKMDRISTMTAYAACDIFILTALAETQPISILESMAAGKPYISTDTGCVRDMPGGIIADDEKSLTVAIRNLQQNQKERVRLGGLGRQAVMETYSSDKVNAAHHQTVNEILGVCSPTI